MKDARPTTDGADKAAVGAFNKHRPWTGAWHWPIQLLKGAGDDDAAGKEEGKPHSRATTSVPLQEEENAEPTWRTAKESPMS